MRVLVIGGSGHVGSLVVPRLAVRWGHAVTVYDRARLPPALAREGVTFLQGDLDDIAALHAAIEGQEAVLYLAMGQFGRGMARDAAVRASFDVNARGVWQACEAAQQAGTVRRFVYASSLSVYRDALHRPLADEDMPPDALALYGLTKTFGEMTLRRFALMERSGFSAFALRLCFPVETADEVARLARDEDRDCGLTGEETARAFHAALTIPHSSYAALFITGARTRPGRVNLTRAKSLLDWEPDPVEK